MTSVQVGVSLTRRAAISSPIYSALPIMLALLFVASGQRVSWTYFLVGCLGWMVALGLRLPFFSGLRQLGLAGRPNVTMAALSGPLEEGVRLGFLVILSVRSEHGLWFGLGWGTLELLYSVIGAIALGRIIDEGGDDAREVLAFFERFGISQQRMFSPGFVATSLVERLAALAFHVGVSVIVIGANFAVVPIMVVHSMINLASQTAVVQRRLLLFEVGALLVGVTVLLLAVGDLG